MAIHIDSDGNFYFGVSGTTDFANISYIPDFYVTKDGVIRAVSGTIGGWTLGSTSLSSGNISIDSTGEISANYSSSTGWKLEADGDAFFNSIDVRIGGATSETPTTGLTTLDIGSTQIYENNDDLFINTSGTSNFVNIRDRLKLTSTSTTGSNMQLMFDGPGDGDAMGFRHETDWPNSNNGDLIWTNQSGSGDYNKIAYVTTTDDYFHLGSDAPGIKTDFTGSPTFTFDGPGSPGTDSATFNMAIRPYSIKDKDGQVGSSGQVLSSTGSRIDWIDLPSGNDHPDSDHSFLTQTTADGRYVLSSSHSHSGFITSVPNLTMSTNTGDLSGMPFITNVSGHNIVRTNTTTTNVTMRSINVPYHNFGAYSYDLGSGPLNSYDDIWGGGSNIVSDIKAKENIVETDLGLDFINSLNPVKYKFKDIDLEATDENGDLIHTDWNPNKNPTRTRTHYGLIAQEVKEALKTAHPDTYTLDALYVHTPNEDGEYIGEDEEFEGWSLRYNELISPLVKAVQELSTQISDLTARVEVLEG